MANDMMFSGLTESILPPANNVGISIELSWLAFNERVLALAEDMSLPLAERLRFVSISADNLHEFFMVRIAGLRQLQQRGVHRVRLMIPSDTYRCFTSEAQRFWPSKTGCLPH